LAVDALARRRPRYLRNFVQARYDDATPYSLRSWSTTQAYALYILALAGKAEPAYNEKFFAARDRLTIQGKAWLLKALHLAGQTEARAVVERELLNLVKATPGLAHFEEGGAEDLRWIYSSNVRATAVILQALLETGSQDPLLPGAAKWLVAERRTGRWSSTQRISSSSMPSTSILSGRRRAPDFRTISPPERRF
jgi:hypothetical protein